MSIPTWFFGVQAIKQDHERLSAILHGLQYLVRGIETHGKPPDLKVFRAMLYYISEYPERVHHPKEDRYLFARLRQRTNELDEVLDELQRQHAAGETLLHELEHALNRYELEGASAFPRFRDLVADYARFYSNHMRLEEDVVLPVAMRQLTAEDWAMIHAGFAAGQDPLKGVGPKDNFQTLFTLIVNTAPAPVGLGPPI